MATLGFSGESSLVNGDKRTNMPSQGYPVVREHLVVVSVPPQALLRLISLGEPSNDGFAYVPFKGIPVSVI